jgi:hypothetical protein
MSVVFVLEACHMVIERRKMMLKRRPLIFFTLVLTIVALFAASAAMAAPPEKCTVEVPAKGKKPPIEIIISPDVLNEWLEDCPFEVPDGFDDKCYRSRYLISENVQHVYMAFPKEFFDNFEIFYAGGPSSWDVLDGPCEPGSVFDTDCTKVELNFQYQAVQPPRFELYYVPLTNYPAGVDAGNIVVDVSGKNYVCGPDGIIVSTVAFEATGVAPSSRICVNLPGKKQAGDEAHLWFERIKDTESCIDTDKDFYICIGTCPDSFPDPIPSTCQKLTGTPDELHIVASILKGQKCPNEGFKQSFTNSPFYFYETWAGGYYYSACYDYGTSGGSAGWKDVRCCTVPGFCP